MAEAEGGFVTEIAKSLGAEETSIRLLLSLFAGYPIAFTYRAILHGRSATLQHIFFIITGLLLCYFNFGADTIHSVVNVVSIWALIKVLGGTGQSVVIAFIFNTLYLVCGYYQVTGDDYDISWATPHCVLTLRLTGVVFDLYDGHQKTEKLSAEQKETALHNAPSLLEMMSHVFYFGGFLVGPQFSMSRYQSFVSGKFTEQHNLGPPRNVSQAMTKLVGGVLYIASFQVMVGFFFTNNYMLTSQFNDLSLISKLVYILVWGKLTLGKYAGVWLVVEGSCMLTGLTHNGEDMNGNTLWDGCTNIRVYEMETFATFKELVACFNVNTNYWMAKYVFKRCKGLGNRHLSQGITLTYISLWHGLCSGYYMNFFLEFIMLVSEAQLLTTQECFPAYKQWLRHPVFKAVVWTVRRLTVQFAVSYALVSFVHLNWDRYMQIYGGVYYAGHLLFLLLPVVCVGLKSCLKSSRTAYMNGHAANKESSIQKKKEQ